MPGCWGSSRWPPMKAPAKSVPPRDVVPPDVRPPHACELRRAPALHLGRQRRARGAQAADARQVAALRQLHAGLHAVGVEGRARAEAGHAGLGREAPQHAPVGPVLAAAGAAVEDHAGGAAQQARDLGIPHHPPRGAVPVVALAPAVGVVAAAHVVVQGLELQGHQHHAAMAVDDGLGQAGGAAGVDDPQRVVEGQPFGLEGRRGRVVARRDLAVVGGIGQPRLQIQVGHKDHMLHAGQACAQLRQHGHAVDIAPGVVHAIDGDQRLGRDLAKAVQHRVGAHVGRADAPDGAQAGRGQQGDHGLGDVGQVGSHAVAAAHALGLQVQGQGGDLAAQLGPGQFAVAARLVAADHGGHAGRMGGIHMAQRLARVVDLGARKPLGAGHGVALQHGRVRRGRLQRVVVPDALPEGVQVGHRPAPQRVVAVELQAVALAQPVLVQADLGDEGRGMAHDRPRYARAAREPRRESH